MDTVLTIGEIAQRVGGCLAFPGGATPPESPEAVKAAAGPIHGAAAIAQAGERDISFLGNPKYLPQLKETRAACVLVPEGAAAALAGQAPATLCLLEVANPSFAFSQILELFAPVEIPIAVGIHATAVLADDVELGEGVAIGAHAVIGAGATLGPECLIGANTTIGPGSRLGEGCQIHANVTLRERSQLGKRVIIHSGTVIGSDGFGYELVEGKHVKIPQTGIVQIDDDVEIGANVTIDRARFGRTWIGEGTKIDNLVQIAHNVEIGKHCIIVSQTGISGSAKLADYVTLAGQVGVVGHIEIASHVVVAAKGGVSKSIKQKGVLWGTPAVPLKEAKERIAYINRLPKLWERVRQLEALFEGFNKKLGDSSK